MAIKSGYDDGMEIRYFLELEDLVAFTMREEVVQQNIRKSHYLSLGLSVLLISIGYYLISPQSPWKDFPVLGAILILTGILAPIFNIREIPKTFQRRLEKYYSKSGMTFPIQVIAKLADEGLIGTSAKGTGTIKYSAFVSVVEYPESTYLMISRIEGHPINHSKVTSGDLKAFLQELATKNPALVPQKGLAKYNFPKS
jgi:hypothetical protein